VRERPAPISEDEIPNKDIRVSEEFLDKNESTVVWLTVALTRAMAKEKAVDRDAREALDSLIRTYRTLESGLIYETRPQNPYAAAIQEALKQSVDELRKRLAEASGMATLRDADILGTLVFLQRLELQYSNSRPRGRAFFDFLRTSFPEPPLAESLAV
jgi:hypothetical protein